MTHHAKYDSNRYQLVGGSSIDSEWTEHEIPDDVIDYIKEELGEIKFMTDLDVCLWYNVDYRDNAIMRVLEYYWRSTEYGDWKNYIEELTERYVIDFNVSEIERRIAARIEDDKRQKLAERLIKVS